MAGADEAIDAIYAASLGSAGWQDVVARIGALFETATGTFYIDRNVANGVEASVVASFGHSAAAIDSYHRHFGSVNPFDRNLDRLPIGETLTEADLDRRLRVAGAFESSEYFNDWVRPQHVRHVIGGYVGCFDTGTLVASFWRPSDRGAYTPTEVASFDRLMRHATRAIDIGDRLRASEGAMEALVGRGGTAVVTIGRDGRIRRTNDAADALLARSCGLAARGGLLAAADGEDQKALDRLIACVFDPRRVSWAEGTRLPIRRTDGGAPLVVRIVAVAQRFAPFAFDEAASAIVTVRGFEEETSVRVERLRRRFGLTPSQARLADQLRAGRSLREAGLDLGIEPETARSHLKRVFARTGTHRQTELVLLLREAEDR